MSVRLKILNLGFKLSLELEVLAVCCDKSREDECPSRGIGERDKFEDVSKTPTDGECSRDKRFLGFSGEDKFALSGFEEVVTPTDCC